jgi:hypothetical protein
MLDASQYTSNGFSMSGCANTGAVVRSFFKVRNTSSHYGLHLNLAFFFESLVIGLAILEKFEMNQR